MGLHNNGGPDVVMSSDGAARAADDIEIVVGEGPVHACRTEGPLIAEKVQMRDRWALYSAAVRPLDIVQVASVPLKVRDLTFGSLTAFGTTTSPIGPELSELCTIGDALVELLVAEVDSPDGDPSGLMSSADFRDVLNQAAGIASVQYECSIGDALALLRAHSFSSGSDLAAVAASVVDRTLRFDRH